MLYQLFGRKRANFLRIYQKWQVNNRSRHALFVLSLSVYVMTFMILFDGLFVADPGPFIQTRFIALALLIPAFAIARALQQNRELLQNRPQVFLQSVLVLFGPVLIHAQYLYLTFIHEHEKVPIYFIGMMMVVFYGSFVLHKYWKEQYIFNAFGILSGVGFVFMFPKFRDLEYVLIVSHLVAGFIFIYFRRDFVDNLYAIHSLLKMMVPERVADVLAVSNGAKDTADYFKPEERFTVCLCADWRNFQGMTKELLNDEMSEMLEKFYDVVLAKLKTLVPAENYYFNWNADEFFIVFFSDTGSEHEVMTNVLSFATALVHEVFAEVSVATGKRIYFDVGIAAGKGRLGLLGPKFMKKTTIVGEVAGRAKRFQYEAKKLRQEFNHEVLPVVIMDSPFYHFMQQSHHPEAHLLKQMRAKAKDVRGVQCFAWVTDQHISTWRKNA